MVESPLNTSRARIWSRRWRLGRTWTGKGQQGRLGSPAKRPLMAASTSFRFPHTTKSHALVPSKQQYTRLRKVDIVSVANSSDGERYTRIIYGDLIIRGVRAVVLIVRFIHFIVIYTVMRWEMSACWADSCSGRFFFLSFWYVFIAGGGIRGVRGVWLWKFQASGHVRQKTDRFSVPLAGFALPFHHQLAYCTSSFVINRYFC